jgi:uncharacterized protein (TIGR03437 family)
MKTLALLAVSTAAVWGATPLPMAFEPNRGQLPGPAGFVAHTRAYSLSVAAGRTELVSRGARVTAVLAGSRSQARAQAEEKLPGVVNYLIGDSSRWITNIPTYSRVRYRGIYPGVDVLYYGHEGRLEYDLIVAPGADPGLIRLRFEGVRRMRVDAAGDLLLDTGDGEIRQHRPVVYQETAGGRLEVAGRYLVTGKTVRFALAGYDQTRPLVIDPVLTWATYYNPLGQATTNTGEGVAVDSSGNIYMAGSILIQQGYSKAYVTKLNPAGAAVVASTYYGGSYDDEAHAIAVDAGGNIYLTGHTNSPDFPLTNYAVSPYFNPPYSVGAFISKLPPGLTTFAYSILLAGSNNDVAVGVALDSASNAYIVGYTGSTDYPVTSGVAQTSSAGGADIFVSGINAAGTNFIFSTYLGGSGDDLGYGIAVDSSNNVYVAGQTASTNFPVTSSAYQSKLAGGTDAFVTKLAANTGTVVFSTYVGGSGTDYASAVAVDSTGVYIDGETASTDFPAVNAVQSKFGGGTGDVFVTKLKPDGSGLLYSTYIGGSSEDAAYGLAVDPAGNAYVTGGTTSKDYPLTDAFQATNQAPVNALVTALNSSGSGFLFSSYLGGSGTATAGDLGNAITASCPAGVVVAGNTSSTNFPVTSGVVDGTFGGGGSDAFLARIGSGGMPSISPGGIVNSATSTSTPVAPGSLITIYGSGMGLSTLAASATPLPTSLAGVTVTINGTAAPIVYASAIQMNVQLPYEVGGATAAATVTVPCGTSTPISFPVAPAAPYIFVIDANGTAAARNPDGSINGPNNPVAAGSYITVYLTGIGPLDNAVPTGAAAPLSPLSNATLPKSATIGGSTANVLFLGLTPQAVGEAQANLVIPNVGSGPHPVVITVGGVASNGPTIYVK